MTRTPDLPNVPAQDDGARWAAVLARDASCDGTFVFSVVTTGIYCRPSCPARRAKRENVRFFDNCIEAEAAGFRACMRCKPGERSLAEQHAVKVTEACRLIDEAGDVPALEEIARAVGFSPYHFHRVFKAIVGLTPRAYASARRQQRVREKLQGSATVTEAIFDAGFNSSSRFYAKSSEMLGMTPADFRAGGSNAQITFAIARCTLGLILAAASDKGVCAILLGDDPDALVRELQDRFPRAGLREGDEVFGSVIAKVVAFVESPATDLDLPLDIQGTAFQHRVWQALRAIPSGETISYAELARRIGDPRAVRAVAGACAANRIAVAIPCHRVLKSDGSLSGYRWGVERKRALLRKETKS